MESTKSAAQMCAFLQGQVAALGVAVHALLKTHPHRDQVALQVHEGIEQLLAVHLSSALPDEFEAGLASMRDGYLLKTQADPGQPQRP